MVMSSDIVATEFECGVLSSKVEPGAKVAITGSGPTVVTALLTAQFYAPAEIIMTDLDHNRLATGMQFGASGPINSKDSNAVQQLLAMTGGHGIDAAIETVGIASRTAISSSPRAWSTR